MTYLVVGVTVGAAWGVGWGLLASVAAPLSGALALGMIERIHRMGGAIAGYRAMRAGGPITETIRARRAAVVDTARQVLDADLIRSP